jgi:hypothetical protein
MPHGVGFFFVRKNGIKEVRLRPCERSNGVKEAGQQLGETGLAERGPCAEVLGP